MITSSVTVGESLFFFSILHELANFNLHDSPMGCAFYYHTGLTDEETEAQRDVKWLAQGVFFFFFPRGLKASKCKSQISNLNILASEVVSFPLLHVNCSAVPDRESFINVSYRYCYIWTSLILTTSPHVHGHKESLDEYGWWNCNTIQSMWPYLLLFFLLLVLCYNVDLWESYKNSAEFMCTFTLLPQMVTTHTNVIITIRN